jgi:hypothetical protein
MTDDELVLRTRDVIKNMSVLTPKGQLGLMSPHDGGAYWMELWTHLLEEHNSRGGLRPNLLEDSDLPNTTYPERPKAVTALQNMTLPKAGTYLVKFMKRKYAESLVSGGNIRVSPASSYNDPSLNSAINDDELTVCTRIPKNEVSITLLDKENGVPKGDIPLISDITVNISSSTDYYVWCMAYSLDIRLFDDFESDACVIIHEPARLFERMRQQMLSHIGNWDTFVAKVRYFDPCLTNSKHVEPFGCKHFRYSYQKELRIMWLPTAKATMELSPQELSLGSLEDICELIVI